MKVYRYLFPVLLMMGCAGEPTSDNSARVGSPGDPAGNTTKSIAAPPVGREIYTSNCAECHGGNGEGTKKGISLIKGHALLHTAEDFVDRVTYGKADVMPSFKDKLTEAEIAEVVRYVREDIQGPSTRKDQKPK